MNFNKDFLNSAKDFLFRIFKTLLFITTWIFIKQSINGFMDLIMEVKKMYHELFF